MFAQSQGTKLVKSVSRRLVIDIRQTSISAKHFHPRRQSALDEADSGRPPRRAFRALFEWAREHPPSPREMARALVVPGFCGRRRFDEGARSLHRGSCFCGRRWGSRESRGGDQEDREPSEDDREGRLHASVCRDAPDSEQARHCGVFRIGSEMRVSRSKSREIPFCCCASAPQFPMIRPLPKLRDSSLGEKWKFREMPH